MKKKMNLTSKAKNCETFFKDACRHSSSAKMASTQLATVMLYVSAPVILAQIHPIGAILAGTAVTVALCRSQSQKYNMWLNRLPLKGLL